MLLKSSFHNWLASSDLLYRWCRSIVDRRQGENNCDMRTNGELRMLRRNLPQCRRVFDVGANVGHWTRLALEINPDLEIHCFEPARPTYERLLANQFPVQVRCNNLGCGAQAGQGKLYVFADGAGINSMYQRQGLESYGLQTPERSEGIELITLDDYCEAHGIASIDFVKMDVEGHELQVFLGMQRLLGDGCVGAIQFEYGGAYIDARVFLHDIFKQFAGLPYSFYKIHARQLEHHSRYDQRLENMQYQNWLILRDDFPFRK